MKKRVKKEIMKKKTMVMSDDAYHLVMLLCLLCLFTSTLIFC